MNIDEVIEKRRSVRIYNDKKVADSDIKKIVKAGMWAPSACNLQQWKFIVIDDENIFKKLYSLGCASFVRNVKQAILIIYNNQTDNLEYNDYIQSASAAIQNMLLKANSMGIGTCWVNNLPNKTVMRNLFGIPKSYDPIALVTLGYYEQVLNSRERKYQVEDVISYNCFNFDSFEEKSKFRVVFKRIARRIYKILPCKRIINMFVGKLEKKFDN